MGGGDDVQSALLVCVNETKSSISGSVRHWNPLKGKGACESPVEASNLELCLLQKIWQDDAESVELYTDGSIRFGLTKDCFVFFVFFLDMSSLGFKPHLLGPLDIFWLFLMFPSWVSSITLEGPVSGECPFAEVMS